MRFTFKYERWKDTRTLLCNERERKANRRSVDHFIIMFIMSMWFTLLLVILFLFVCLFAKYYIQFSVDFLTIASGWMIWRFFWFWFWYFFDCYWFKPFDMVMVIDIPLFIGHISIIYQVDEIKWNKISRKQLQLHVNRATTIYLVSVCLNSTFVFCCCSV